MTPKTKFVLLSTLLGGFLFVALGWVWTFIYLQIQGTGPHGYGVFLYIAAPVWFGPTGLVFGLITSLLLKEIDYKKLVIWLCGLGLAVITVGHFALWLYIRLQRN